MDRFVKDYVSPIVYEATSRLPGPVCRIIVSYVKVDRYILPRVERDIVYIWTQHNDHDEVVEIFDIEKLVYLICRKYDNQKFWKWDLMRQLSWLSIRIDKRTIYGCTRCSRLGPKIIVNGDERYYPYSMIRGVCIECKELYSRGIPLLKYIR